MFLKGFKLPLVSIITEAWSEISVKMAQITYPIRRAECAILPYKASRKPLARLIE